MEIPIEARKVAGVVVATNELLKDKSLTRAEIIIGLSEAVGRHIVDASNGNSAVARDVVKASFAHIRKTIEIGLQKPESSIWTPE